MAGRQRQAGLGVKDADHERGHEGAPARIGAPEALAVHRYDAAGRFESQSRPQGVPEACEDAGHFFRIEKAEDATEAVVARNSVCQVDDSGKKIFVGRREIRDLDATLRPTQSRRQRNEQHCRQIMTRVQVERIANLAENRNEWFHQRLPSNQEASEESISALSAIASTHLRFPWGEREGEGGGGRGREGENGGRRPRCGAGLAMEPGRAANGSDRPELGIAADGAVPALERSHRGGDG